MQGEREQTLSKKISFLFRDGVKTWVLIGLLVQPAHNC